MMRTHGRKFAVLAGILGCMMMILTPNADALDEKRLAEYYPDQPDPLIGDYVGRWNDEIDIDFLLV